MADQPLPNESKLHQMWRVHPMATAFLVVVVVYLVWLFLMKTEGFDCGCGPVFGYDNQNALTSAGLYGLVDSQPASAWGNLGWVGQGAASPGRVFRDDRMTAGKDWMTSRFVTSARDNFINPGMNADSIVSPTSNVVVGPEYVRPDVRDAVGVAYSETSNVPLTGLGQFIDYGDSSSYY